MGGRSSSFFNTGLWACILPNTGERAVLRHFASEESDKFIFIDVMFAEQ